MSRNSRRRRNFFLEDAEDYLDPVDAFSNPDLDSRVQIFSSEAQVRPTYARCCSIGVLSSVIMGAAAGCFCWNAHLL
jgi:hypothetical protein